jgi:hypothetical protein
MRLDSTLKLGIESNRLFSYILNNKARAQACPLSLGTIPEQGREPAAARRRNAADGITNMSCIFGNPLYSYDSLPKTSKPKNLIPNFHINKDQDTDDETNKAKKKGSR